MFQKLKKVALLLSCTLSVSLLAGCGNSFDASAYAKALLDNTFKNDSAAYVEMKIGTKEEAEEYYNEGIDAQVDQAMSMVGATEEQSEDFRALFKDIFSSVKYTVGDAEKQDDGSYNVTIKYQKMNIFGPAITSYMEEITELSTKVQSGEVTLSEDEAIDTAINMYRDNLRAALDNVTYENEESMTLHIQLENNTYSFDSNAVYQLETGLFDYDAISNLQ